MGILPGVAAWGVLMVKNALRAAGMANLDRPLTAEIVGRFPSDTFMDGGFALESGFIFTAMIWSAATVAILERRFPVAAAWCLAGAGLSAAGLMHSYAYTPFDVVQSLSPAWPWAVAYLAMAALFGAAEWITEPGEGH
jgi:AGZA family xanthine/uracil permease-like MFS transporter